MKLFGNFRFAKKFGTITSKVTYENVYFDRFNSVRRGFYLVVGERQLTEAIESGETITFIKIPSTERFGSQDVIELEFASPGEITPGHRKFIYLLNNLIGTKSYKVLEDKNNVTKEKLKAKEKKVAAAKEKIAAAKEKLADN